MAGVGRLEPAREAPRDDRCINHRRRSDHRSEPRVGPSPEEAEQITRHFLVKLVDGDALQHRSHLPRPADPGEMVLAATVGHGVGYVAAD